MPNAPIPSARQASATPRPWTEPVESYPPGQWITHGSEMIEGTRQLPTVAHFRSHADATAAVHAVNSHDALVEGLDRIERIAGDAGGKLPAQRCQKIVNLVRELRALARGETQPAGDAP